MAGTTEDSDSAKLLKWWETYAAQLETRLERESEKRLESDAFGWSLVIVALLALSVVYGYTAGWEATLGEDYEWWLVLVWLAVAPWVFGFILLFPSVLLQFPVKALARRKRQAEYVRLVDESRAWAYRSLGYSPPSSFDAREGETGA